MMEDIMPRKMSTAQRNSSLVPGEEMAVRSNDDALDASRLVAAVFNNSLVFENIVPYLSFGDMKAMSEVSRDLCGMVRGSKRFQKKAMLVVTNNGTGVDEVLMNSRQAWRSLRFEITLTVNTINVIRHILASVEFLSFIALEGSVISKGTNACRYNVLMNIFSFTPKLTHIEIDARLVERKMMGSLPPPEILETLKKLKKIEILEWDFKRREFKVSNGPSKKEKSEVQFQIKNDLDEDEELTRMLSVIQFALYSGQLESFSLSNGMTSSIGTIGKRLVVKHTLLILKNNQATLQELSVHKKVWNCEEMKSLVFPNLKRLTVIVDAADQDTLTQFLNRHPSLEELDVGVKGMFARSLFTAIQKQSSKLKKLHIKARRFVGFVHEVDWTFLEEMKLLKDFKITRVHSRTMGIDAFGPGPRFLARLPKNQLEKLSFSGFSKYEFWNAPIFGHVGLQRKTELLQGFSSLKSLSFIHCYRAVDDKLMQFILKEFTNLEELELTCSEQLSEFGISGRNLDSKQNVVDSQISLENLKALTRLTIHEDRLSGMKSLAGILSSLSLPSLKRFEYSAEHKVISDEEFLPKFLKNNPRLETVTGCLPYFVSHYQLEVLVRTERQRCVKIGHLGYNSSQLCLIGSDDILGYGGIDCNEFNDSWESEGERWDQENYSIECLLPLECQCRSL